MVKSEKRTLSIRTQLQNEMTKQLAELRGDVTKLADTTKKQAERASSAWNNLKKVVGLVAVAYASVKLGGFFKEVVDNTDAIAKLARALGSSVEDVSELSFAFSSAGGNAEQFRAVITALASAQNSALEGGKRQIETFQKLGVSLQDIKTLDPIELFKKMGDGTESLEEGTERYLTLVKLFPEQFRNIINLISGGGEALERKLADARRAGATVTAEQARAAEEVNDAFLRIETSIQGVGRSIATEFAPEISGFINKVSTLLQENKGLFISIAKTIKDVVVGALDLMSTAVIELIGLIESIPGIDLTGVSQLEEQRDSIVGQLRSRGFSSATPIEAMGSAQAELLDPVITDLRKQLARVNDEITTASEETLADRLRRLKAGFAAEAKAVTDAIRGGNEQILKANQHRASNGQIWTDVENNFVMPPTQSQAAEAVENTKKVTRSLEVFSRNFGEVAKKPAGFAAGWERATARVTDAMVDLSGTIGATLGSIVDQGIRGLSNGIGDLIAGAKSAKEAWKDFARSFLTFVAQMIGRIIVLGTVKSLFQLEKGGVVNTSGEQATLPFQQFEKGGVATRPTLALFGEGRNSEAFVPLPDNRSIPVTFTGGGGGGNVINLNVYAWDSKDAARGLMENQNVLRNIWQNQAETRHGMRQVIRRAAV